MEPQTGPLGKSELLRLLQSKPPLVEQMPDIQEQVQPNGIDLTLKDIALFSSPGRITVSNAERSISATSPLYFDMQGNITLLPGTYLVTYNEIVNLPLDVMALGKTRSSLTRCGVSLHTAVWDAGYSGRSQSLMAVYNAMGFSLQRNARILQLVFFRVAGSAGEGYKGKYQRENT